MYILQMTLDGDQCHVAPMEPISEIKGCALSEFAHGRRDLKLVPLLNFIPLCLFIIGHWVLQHSLVVGGRVRARALPCPYIYQA